MALFNPVEHIDDVRVVGLDDVVVDDQAVVVQVDWLVGRPLFALQRFVDVLRHPDNGLAVIKGGQVVLLVVQAGVNVNPRRLIPPEGRGDQSVVISIHVPLLNGSVDWPRPLIRHSSQRSHVGRTILQVGVIGCSSGRDNPLRDVAPVNILDLTPPVRDSTPDGSPEQSSHGIEHRAKVDIGSSGAEDAAESSDHGVNDTGCAIGFRGGLIFRSLRLNWRRGCRRNVLIGSIVASRALT